MVLQNKESKVLYPYLQACRTNIYTTYNSNSNSRLEKLSSDTDKHLSRNSFIQKVFRYFVPMILISHWNLWHGKASVSVSAVMFETRLYSTETIPFLLLSTKNWYLVPKRF